MKRFALILVALVVAVMFIPQPASAATKSMKAYDQVIKSKKTVFCSDGQNIFQVSLKTGKVKQLTARAEYDGDMPIRAMKLKGKYIYYAEISNGTTQASISRVKKGKWYSNQQLAYTDALEKYAVKGKKIYYIASGEKRVMNLNGSKNKATKHKAKWKIKKSNTKKYKIIVANDGTFFKSWLKTPKKKIPLETMPVGYYDDL